MSKYVKLEKGTLVKEDVEYDYIVEIAKDFPKEENNVRIKIIEERPKIRKIQTRYDPDITMFGDQNSSMEIMMGYDMEELQGRLRGFLSLVSFPFVLAFLGFSVSIFPHIEITSKSHIWIVYAALLILIPLMIYSIVKLALSYFEMTMSALADYLKAKDIKKELKENGFNEK